MTTILRIEHPVHSYDEWKRMFDSDPLGRKKSGVRRYRIMRPVDNQYYVMLDLEFNGEEQAENFAAALHNLWNSSQVQSVMRSPQLRIVTHVESKELKG